MIGIDRQKIENSILYILLLMVSIRFMNKNNTFMLLFCAAMIVVLIARKVVIEFPVEGISLVIFGVLYCILGGYTTDGTAIFSNGIGAILMYFAGYNILNAFDGKSRRRHYRTLIFTIALGNVLFMLLSFLRHGTTIMIDPLYARDDRYVGDFWTGDLFYCTNFNSYGVLFCIICICVIMQHYSTLWTILTAVFTASALAISAATGSRTDIYIFVLSIPGYFLIRYLYRELGSHFKSKPQEQLNYSGRYFMLSLAAAVLLFAVVVCWDWISSELSFDVYIQRNADRGFSIADDGRWKKWADVISLIPQYPFGGMPYSWAHNLYLDIVRIAGIIPAFFCLIFTISNIRVCCGLKKRSTMDEENSLLAIMLTLFLLLSFMIEPTLEAKPYVFMSYCFVVGMNRYFYQPKVLFVYDRKKFVLWQ